MTYFAVIVRVANKYIDGVVATELEEAGVQDYVRRKGRMPNADGMREIRKRAVDMAKCKLESDFRLVGKNFMSFGKVYRKKLGFDKGYFGTADYSILDVIKDFHSKLPASYRVDCIEVVGLFVEYTDDDVIVYKYTPHKASQPIEKAFCRMDDRTVVQASQYYSAVGKKAKPEGKSKLFNFFLPFRAESLEVALYMGLRVCKMFPFILEAY